MAIFKGDDDGNETQDETQGEERTAPVSEAIPLLPSSSTRT